VIFRYLVLLAGVLACSTAAVALRLTTLHPVQLAGYRLLVAAAALWPVWWRSRLRHRASYSARDLRRSVLPAVFMAVHFCTWIMGVRMTATTNASLIVNMVPVAMPFLMFMFAGEVLNRGELAGTALALCGVGLLAVGDYHISLANLLGDLVCVVSMICMATYLALGRRSREVADIWLYIVPLYAIAGLICVAVSLCFENPVRVYAGRDLLVVLWLGLVPTVMGHSALMYSMKHLRSQLVAIATLHQFLFVGIFAYLILGEVPVPLFPVACVLAVSGAVVTIRATPT
jgi:drug/metabolite transporter (DMT)-like permease